jgi:hypothetical protein
LELELEIGIPKLELEIGIPKLEFGIEIPKTRFSKVLDTLSYFLHFCNTGSKNSFLNW